MFKHFLAVLILVIAATAIAPPITDSTVAGAETDRVCTWGSATKRVDQGISFFGLWTVTMTAAVKYDNCGHVKLAWDQCSVSYVTGWSAKVTWCDAYYPSGLNGSTKINVGFNAQTCAPGRCAPAWSRRWAYANGTFGPQRAEIP